MTIAPRPPADDTGWSALSAAWRDIGRHLSRVPVSGAREHARRWSALHGPIHRDAEGLMMEVLAARYPHGATDVDQAVRHLGGAVYLGTEGRPVSAVAAAAAVRDNLADQQSTAATEPSRADTRPGAIDRRVLDHASARWAIHAAWQRFGDALHARRLDGLGRLRVAWWEGTGSSLSDSAAALAVQVARDPSPPELRRAGRRLAMAVQATTDTGVEAPEQAARLAVQSWMASECFLRAQPGPRHPHEATATLFLPPTPSSVVPSLENAAEHDLSPPTIESADLT
jgi:hypothetical protein